MATSKPTASVLECSICLEDFKQPKLLPCSHSFCLGCLEKLQANQGRVRIISCPECRNKWEVPKRGVGAFPDNRYLDVLLTMKRTNTCVKHGLPLQVFCDEPECQLQLCPTCAVLKHGKHNLVEIEDKAKVIKKKMGDTKETVRQLSDELGDHLNALKIRMEHIRATKAENLQAVANTRSKLLQKIAELGNQVKMETEKQEMEIAECHDEALQEISAAREDAEMSKLLLSGLFINIEKSIETLSHNDIIENSEQAETALREIARTELAPKYSTSAKVKEVTYTKPDLINQLKLTDVGRIDARLTSIENPAQVQSIAESSTVTPRLQLLNKFSVNAEVWKLIKMCTTKSGRVVYSSKDGSENWLKCFSTKGDILWKQHMGKAEDSSVNGICCVEGAKSYLLVSREKTLELRDLTDGSVVHTCATEKSPGHSCYTQDGSILVKNASIFSSNITVFKLLQQPQLTLENTDAVLLPPSVGSSVFGLDQLLLETTNQKLVIVTSWTNNTVQAFDYNTDTVVWKTPDEFDGKKIEPHGICHDELGNLYVADGRNSRILLLSSDGKIQKKLVDTEGTTYWVGLIDSPKRLVVHTQTGNKEEVSIHVYTVNYEPS